MKKRSLFLVLLTLVIIIVAVVALKFNTNTFTNGGKIIIVGATWDIPEGRISGIDFSNSTNLQDNIETAARSLANGTNLIVAGEVLGPISEDTYQSIIYRANQINRKHKGSIIRIGGKDRYETQKLIESYLEKH